MSLLWLLWDPLQWLLNLDTLLLGFSVKAGVLLNALLELVTALGVADVLGPDVDPLWSDVVVHTAVDEETDGAWGNVPNDASAAVVESVRHALVDSAIDMDIDDVANAVCPELDRRSWHSVLAVLPPEEIASAPTKTGGVTHSKRTSQTADQRTDLLNLSIVNFPPSKYDPVTFLRTFRAAQGNYLSPAVLICEVQIRYTSFFAWL